MTAEQEDKRFSVIMEPALFQKVRAYEYKNDLKSTAEAVRVLVQKGLDAEKK